MVMIGWFIVVLTLLSGSALFAVFGLGPTIALITRYGMPIQQMVQLATQQMDSWPLLAMPLFILAGSLMSAGGIANNLVLLMQALLRHFRGGLMAATIAFCTIFAAISGSGYAAIAAVGTIMMPEMHKAGYPDSLSSAAIAVSGELGILIPPSLFFIIWGMLTLSSAGALFAAGLIPGLAVAAIYMVVGVAQSRAAKVPSLPAASWSERGTTLVKAIPALIMPIIILGGIYTGFFTPTEAAAVSCAYAVLVGVFVYRTLNWKSLSAALGSTAETSVVMYASIGGIGVFAYLISISNVGAGLANFIIGMGLNKLAFLAMVSLVFIAVGFLIDPWTLAFIMVPFLTPTFKAMGIDMVYAGVLFCLGTMIGEMTPPNAFGLYLTAKVCKVDPATTVNGIWVFLAAETAALYALILFPDIALWLPRTMGLMAK